MELYYKTKTTYNINAYSMQVDILIHITLFTTPNIGREWGIFTCYGFGIGIGTYMCVQTLRME